MKLKKSIAVFMILCLVVVQFSNETIIKAISNAGDGTADNPFLISSAEEFNRIRDNLNSCYKLTKDIDFNGGTLTPIGTSTVPFKGTLDGDGHAIKNFKINATDSYVGLFRYATSAKLRNLVIEKGEIKGGSYTGALAGYLNGCTTENISLIDITVTGGQYCGTLTGFAGGGSIRGCSVTGTGMVTGTSSLVGGLLGYTSLCPVTYCLAVSDK